MPTFEVTGPDGTVYEVDAPEGATEQDAIAYIQSNMDSVAPAEPEPEERGLLGTVFGEKLGGDAIREGYNIAQRNMALTLGGDKAAEVFAQQQQDLESVPGYAERENRIRNQIQRASEADGWFDATMQFILDPGTTFDLALRSTGQSAPGTAAGGIAGAPFGPLGTVIGGMAGAGGMSLAQEITGHVAGSMEQAGVDLSDQNQVATFLQDEQRLAELYEYGARRGWPIAALDAVSMGIAGRVYSPVARTVGQVADAAEASRLAKTAGVGGEVASQGTLGGTGEVLGALNVGEEVQKGDVLAEVFGEIASGGVEAAANTALGQYDSPTPEITYEDLGFGPGERPPEATGPPARAEPSFGGFTPDQYEDIPVGPADRSEPEVGDLGSMFAGEPMGVDTGLPPPDNAPEPEIPPVESAPVSGPAPSPAPVTGGPASSLPDPMPDQVSTARGSQIDVIYDVIEADELITSDDERFPGDLQPRQRDRASSDAQIAEIAANLEPGRLGRSPEADRGAPIIGPDNVVESGNGRVAAIRRAMAEDGEAADKYRVMIEQLTGIDVGDMRDPVLVRRRTTEMTPEQRQAFAIEANEQATMQMTDSERANADAALLGPTVGLYQPGQDVGSASNRDFVRAFIEQVSPADRGQFLDQDGNLSQAGIRRINAAMLAAAYGGSDAANSTLNRMLESTDDNVRSATGALMDAAPAFAQLRQAELHPDYDISENIIKAIETVSSLRAEGQGVQEYLDQDDMFGERDLVTDELIRALYNPDMTRAAGRERIAAILEFYADEVSREQGGQTSLLMNEDTVTAEEYIREGKQRAWQGEGQAPQQGGLLETPATPESPPASSEQDGGSGAPTASAEPETAPRVDEPAGEQDTAEGGAETETQEATGIDLVRQRIPDQLAKFESAVETAGSIPGARAIGEFGRAIDDNFTAEEVRQLHKEIAPGGDGFVLALPEEIAQAIANDKLERMAKSAASNAGNSIEAMGAQFVFPDISEFTPERASEAMTKIRASLMNAPVTRSMARVNTSLDAKKKETRENAESQAAAILKNKFGLPKRAQDRYVFLDLYALIQDQTALNTPRDQLKADIAEGYVSRSTMSEKDKPYYNNHWPIEKRKQFWHTAAKRIVPPKQAETLTEDDYETNIDIVMGVLEKQMPPEISQLYLDLLEISTSEDSTDGEVQEPAPDQEVEEGTPETGEGAPDEGQSETEEEPGEGGQAPVEAPPGTDEAIATVQRMSAKVRGEALNGTLIQERLSYVVGAMEFALADIVRGYTQVHIDRSDAAYLFEYYGDVAGFYELLPKFEAEIDGYIEREGGRDVDETYWATFGPRDDSRKYPFENKPKGTTYQEFDDQTIPVEGRVTTDWRTELFSNDQVTISMHRKPRNEENVVSPDEATKIVDGWKKHAADQRGKVGLDGKTNSQRTIIMLFEESGVAAQPWVEAGYTVYTFDAKNGVDIDDIDVDVLYDHIENPDDVYGVFMFPPCTVLSSASNARTFEAADKDGRTEAAKQLVFNALNIVEKVRPRIWMLENPRGSRIGQSMEPTKRNPDQEKWSVTGLGKPALNFSHYHYGDDFHKPTSLWGNFNPELPTANLGGASKGTANTPGGKTRETKKARSKFPEGFSYAFFMANNYLDTDPQDNLHWHFPWSTGMVDLALERGMSADEIFSAAEYYEGRWTDEGESASRDIWATLTAEVAAASNPDPEPAPAAEPEGLGDYLQVEEVDTDNWAFGTVDEEGVFEAIEEGFDSEQEAIEAGQTFRARQVRGMGGSLGGTLSDAALPTTRGEDAEFNTTTTRQRLRNEEIAEAAIEEMGGMIGGTTITPGDFKLMPPQRQYNQLRKMIMANYGFKDLTFRDKWSWNERTDMLLQTYAHLSGHASVLSLNNGAVSLNGLLSLNFYKSDPQHRTALAYYRPADRSIHIKGWNSSFSHEWAHAFDHWLNDINAFDDVSYLLTHTARRSAENLTLGQDITSGLIEMMQAMYYDQAALALDLQKIELKLQRARSPKSIENLEKQRRSLSKRIEASSFYKNSKDSDYLSQPTEMFARAVEAIIGDMVREQGGNSGLLAKSEQWYAGAGYYPQAQERLAIRAGLLKMMEGLNATAATKQVANAGTPADVNKQATQAFNPQDWPDMDASGVPALPIDETARRSLMASAVAAARSGGKTVQEDLEQAIRFTGQIFGTYLGMLNNMERKYGKNSNVGRGIAWFRNRLFANPGSGAEGQFANFESIRNEQAGAYLNRMKRIVRKYGIDKWNENDRITMFEALTLNNEEVADGALDRVHPRIRAAAQEWRNMMRDIRNETEVAMRGPEGTDVARIGYVGDAGYMPYHYDIDAVERSPEKFLKASGKYYADVRKEEISTLQAVIDELSEYQMAGDIGKNGRKLIELLQEAIDNIAADINADTGDIANAIARIIARQRFDEQLKTLLEEAPLTARHLQSLTEEMIAKRPSDRAKGHYQSLTSASIADRRGAGPQASFLKSRTLKSSSVRYLADFIVRDPLEATNAYIMQNARRQAYSQLFGQDGQYAEALLDVMARPDGKATPLEARDANLLKHIFQDTVGKIDPGLPSEFTQKLNQTRSFLVRTMLGKVIFSAWQEPTLGLVRSGNVADLGVLLDELRKALWENVPGVEAENRQMELLEYWGVISDEMSIEALVSRSELAHMQNAQSAAANAQFYRNNFMSGWFDVTGQSNARVAWLFMQRRARRYRGDKPGWGVAFGSKELARAELADLGISGPNMDYLVEFIADTPYSQLEIATMRDHPAAPFIRTALSRFVNDVRHNNSKGYGGIMANNQVFAWVTALFSWIRAHQRLLHMRLGKQLANAKTPGDRLVILARFWPAYSAYLFVTALFWQVYKAMFYDPFGGEDDEDMTATEKAIMEAAAVASRAGSLARLDAFVNNFVTSGLKYEGDSARMFAGPPLSMVSTDLNNIRRLYADSNSDNTTNAELAHAKGLYGLSIRPIMTYLTGKVPGVPGKVVGVANMVVGSSKFRDYAIEATTGLSKNSGERRRESRGY